MPLTEVAVNEGCGWGGLQVYGIFSRRLVYSEAVDAQSNYNKPYLWWFRNLGCYDSTESKRIEKARIGVPLGLVWGKGRVRVVWLSVCETLLDD